MSGGLEIYCIVGRMARNAPVISCGPTDLQELERLAGSRTESKQMIERAQIVLGCLAGKRVKEVARTCRTRPNTVIKWRQRFAQRGLAGLCDAPRPGAKPVYGEDFRNRVLALLEQPPPVGQACWDGPAVASVLKSSVHAVWRVLRHEGICLQRQRSWCVSTDKEFAAKAADIVGLYPVVIGRVHALEGGGTKSGWKAANRGVGQDLDASV